MKKTPNTQITAQHLAEFVKTESDFHFEMATVNLFSKLLGAVQHGGSYDDPVTKKHRQFDIRAILSHENVHLKIAAECKNLKKTFPLLVSRVPRMPKESFYEVLCTFAEKKEEKHVLGIKIPSLPDFHRFNTSQVKKNCLRYKSAEFVGKSSNQVGIKGDDFLTGDSEVYDKWSQAISSAYDLLENSREDYRLSNSESACTVVIPMLVVPDETLWIVDYKPSGELIGQPELADSATIFLDKSIGSGAGPWLTLSHLELYTLTGLEKELMRLKTAGGLKGLFPFQEINENMLR